MREWQPIETALKDEIRIIVLSAGEVTVGEWCRYGTRRFDALRRLVQMDHTPCWGDALDRDEDGYPRHIEPTHWMPLPEPPK